MFAPREKSRTARSIRTVLLAGTIAALLVVLGAAAWVSFDASEEEAQELFDARLATSGRVLEALVARQVEQATIAAPIVITLPHPLEAADHDKPNPLGDYYETKIAFQVLDDDGKLLVRSASAPDAPLAPLVAGFSTQAFEQRQWRVSCSAPATSGCWSPSGTMRGGSCRRSSRSWSRRRSSWAFRCSSCSSAC